MLARGRQHVFPSSSLSSSTLDYNYPVCLAAHCQVIPREPTATIWRRRSGFRIQLSPNLIIKDHSRLLKNPRRPPRILGESLAGIRIHQRPQRPWPILAILATSLRVAGNHKESRSGSRKCWSWMMDWNAYVIPLLSVNKI